MNLQNTKGVKVRRIQKIAKYKVKIVFKYGNKKNKGKKAKY